MFILFVTRYVDDGEQVADQLSWWKTDAIRVVICNIAIKYWCSVLPTSTSSDLKKLNKSFDSQLMQKVMRVLTFQIAPQENVRVPTYSTWIWPFALYWPVGRENMCGCQTRITLSTPPVAMILALTQKSNEFTPFGIETWRIGLHEKSTQPLSHTSLSL